MSYDKLVEVLKHLPGEHNQSSHAGSRGNSRQDSNSPGYATGTSFSFGKDRVKLKEPLILRKGDTAKARLLRYGEILSEPIELNIIKSGKNFDLGFDDVGGRETLVSSRTIENLRKKLTSSVISAP